MTTDTPVEPLSLYDAHRLLSQVAAQMRSAALELANAHEAHADAERDYRIAQARAWATVEGRSSDERKAQVDAQCANDRHARDIAKGRIDTAKANLSRLDREAASIRFLGGWAQSQAGSAV